MDKKIESTSLDLAALTVFQTNKIFKILDSLHKEEKGFVGKLFSSSKSSDRPKRILLSFVMYSFYKSLTTPTLSDEQLVELDSKKIVPLVKTLLEKYIDCCTDLIENGSKQREVLQSGLIGYDEYKYWGTLLSEGYPMFSENYDRFEKKEDWITKCSFAAYLMYEKYDPQLSTVGLVPHIVAVRQSVSKLVAELAQDCCRKN